MSFASMTLLAFGLSADAFAVSIGSGMRLKRPRFLDAVRIGAIFGFVEGLTPLLGWAVGMASGEFIRQIDHWIAFALLFGMGTKMIYDSTRKIRSRPINLMKTTSMVFLAALATSIDAFSVGFSLAFAQIHIGLAALSIGAMTCGLVMVGIFTGRYMGSRFGRIAEAIGGAGLIIVGGKILLEHLGFLV